MGESLDIHQVIRETFDVVQETGDEWVIRCPNPDHDDQNPSAHVYVGDPERKANGKERLPGMWYCFACHAKGYLKHEATTDQVIASIERDLYHWEHPLRTRYYDMSYLDLFMVGAPHEYWLSRGFTEEHVLRRKLGYDYETNAVTIPAIDMMGRVLGVTRRFLDPEVKPRYKYAKGVDYNDHVYGYEPWNPYAFSHRSQHTSLGVLTEGAIDSETARQDGYYGMAIYGSRVSEAQARIIRRAHFDVLILAFDMDEAGAACTHDAVYGKDFGDADVRVATWPRAWGKDLNSLSEPQRKHVYNEARSAFDI